MLFLITIPTSSGAVERFFSQAGNVSKKQNKLLNQMRRLGRLPAAAIVFLRAVKLSIEGRIAGCFNGVWGGGSIGALLLLAEGVTPLL